MVATGKATFDQLTANGTYRDVFFDALLDKLENGDTVYSTANSYYASVSFSDTIGSVSLLDLGGLGSNQIDKIRAQVSVAKDRQLKSRYWDTPGSPSWVRKSVMETLGDQDVGMLNADDLEEAKSIIMGD